MFENKEVFFSIIIPIYNSEKYLNRILVSICNQSFKDYEVLLINDGSSDNSFVISEEYAKKYNNFKIINKKNSGVSDTRNIGIDHCIGKYVLFFDSDDYVDSNYLEDMHEVILKYNCDLINTGFYSEVEMNNCSNFDKIFCKSKFYKNKDELKKDLVNLWDKHMLYNVWNKVYSAKIIKDNKLYFPNFNFGEDMWFNQKYLKFINTFYNSEKCYYHYIKERQGSITAKFNFNLFELRKKEYYEFNNYFVENGLSEEEYREFSARRFIERALGCIENVCSSDLDNKTKNKTIKSIINDKLTIATVHLAKPKSKKVLILLIPVKIRSVFFTKIVFNFVGIIRKNNPLLFNRLKNRR